MEQSSINDVEFFEGTEKLLEVWFSFSEESTSLGGLRVIERVCWEKLLEHAKCFVLSVCSNDKMDAYVLSESSMFISENRFILKTCGTTTLMNALQPIISLVKENIPEMEVNGVFYSHREFKKPGLQMYPHSSFSDECKCLDTLFKDGSAYVLGNISGDCWYLYIVESIERPILCPDQTLEIVMTKFKPQVLAQFSKAAFSSADELDQALGILDIIPGSKIDSHLFEPCGYSLNGIIKDDSYFTIHVTPQEECAYISFETNILYECYTDLVNRVLNIFQPGSFTLTIFANKVAKCGWSYTALQENCLVGYKCKDKQISVFSLYNVIFLHFILM